MIYFNCWAFKIFNLVIDPKAQLTQVFYIWIELMAGTDKGQTK
jgi:hypothetical protein